MELKIGETKTAKLPIWLKAVEFRCEENGVWISRQNGNAVLNISDRKCRKIYAAVLLGTIKDVNRFGVQVTAYSKNKVLVSVGSIRIVADFAAKKVATNVLGLLVYGTAAWGENVQIPWRTEFMPLFGLPQPGEELDRNTAEVFWKWFHGSETDIVRLLGGTKLESRAVMRQVNLWLCPVFPRIKGKQMDFDLRCKGEEYLFIIRAGGNGALKQDAEEFAAMLPEALAKQWKVVVTE